MKPIFIASLIFLSFISQAQDNCEQTLIEHSEEAVKFEVSVNDTSLNGIAGAQVKIVKLYMKYDEEALVLAKYETRSDKDGNAYLQPVMKTYHDYSWSHNNHESIKCEQNAGFHAGEHFLLVSKKGYKDFSVQISRLNIQTNFAKKTQIKGKVYITLVPM